MTKRIDIVMKIFFLFNMIKIPEGEDRPPETPFLTATVDDADNVVTERESQGQTEHDEDPDTDGRDSVVTSGGINENQRHETGLDSVHQSGDTVTEDGKHGLEKIDDRFLGRGSITVTSSCRDAEEDGDHQNGHQDGEKLPEKLLELH